MQMQQITPSRIHNAQHGMQWGILLSNSVPLGILIKHAKDAVAVSSAYQTSCIIQNHVIEAQRRSLPTIIPLASLSWPMWIFDAGIWPSSFSENFTDVFKLYALS